MPLSTCNLLHFLAQLAGARTSRRGKIKNLQLPPTATLRPSLQAYKALSSGDIFPVQPAVRSTARERYLHFAPGELRSK